MTETNKKHTPGPWTVRDHGGYIEVGTPDEPTVAHFGSLSFDGADHDWALANARLIACAPDLLGAARFALAYLEDHASETSEGDYDAEYAASCDAAVEGLRAAIAKAEGR